jgi:VWFA-related protein
MRKLALFLLLASSVLPAFAAKRVNVEQLERVLTASQHKPDSKAAQQLSDLELTERLSPVRLLYWESALPGPESRRALAVLADTSAFLDPPAAEIPAMSPPDVARQRHIVDLAVDYVARTARQFPNLFATRDTIHFEDSPAGLVAGSIDGAFSPYEPVHPVSRSTATVLYLNGHEIVDRGGSSEATSQGLTTHGEFGPILTTVLVDAAHGTLAWSHWEHGPTRPMAVFRFYVPRERSHYQVDFCCIARQANGGVFRQFSAYHGEIAINPADGTVFRLTLIADLRKADPVVTSDILVDYGPVSLGGKTYVCPIKSISISLAPVQSSGGMRMQDAHGAMIAPAENGIAPPLQTMLNEVVFEQYHLFHAEARVLTGGNEKAGANAAAPPVARANAGVAVANPEAVEKSAPAAVTPAPVAAEQHPVAPSGASVPSASTPPPTVRASIPAEIPEISVTGSPALPGAPDSPLSSGKKAFTLHVTTHIVSVGVVALDKHGHPVADLKAEDFQVYDNGRKQTVRFFSHAAGTPDGQSPPGPEHPHDPSGQLFISNRPSNMVSAKSRAVTTEAGITILLIDANNLAWADLTHARSAILTFLQSLPAGARVGLYVQSGPGFQVLAEGTADHALLASKLRKWMPDAKALARAQETERRNRQQFDYVAHQSDLQYVNGNMNTAPDGATPVDPELRSQGSNPDRDALSILAGVALHLEALSGHKSVVWVTSDNTLANWTDQAVNIREGSRSINGLVLRAQEALNDAHASLYPLDASQLETMAVDPSLTNNSVELSPGVTAPPPAQGGGPGSGRATAELQQDIRAIKPAIQEMAAATGGRPFRRSDEIVKDLKDVIADGRATYLLSFMPNEPADGQYHKLTVKLAARRGIKLRYRTGYLYSLEPSTLQQRFRQAVWQPFDLNDIVISARRQSASEGTALKLNIAADDLGLRLQDQRWTDKLDIFLIERNEDGRHARITGQMLSLKLKQETYESVLRSGVPFDEFVGELPGTGSIRILVVDENSGQVGSLTIPATMLQGQP